MQTPGANEGLSAFTILRALRRRKLFFLAPVLLVTAGALVFTLKMPRRYRAQALIVTQSRMPQSYIKDRPDPAPINVQEQMYAIRAVLFSDPILQTAVSETDPGKAESISGQSPQTGVDALRSKISIQVQAPDAFYLQFEGDEPEQAARVTNRLAELFVQRASAQTGRNVQDAAALLDTQIAQLQRKLADQDERLNAFRAQAAHSLPEQLASDLKMFENLQMQMQMTSSKITDEEARRSAALAEMRALEKDGVLQAPVSVAAAPAPLTGPEAALENARTRLRELQARYTPQHPEVLRTQEEIRSLEQTVGRMGAQRPAAAAAGARTELSQARMRYHQLQAEVESIDQRLKGYQREQQAARAQITTYDQRVRSAPQYGREMAERIKDADFTRSQYEELSKKRQDLRIDEQAAKNNQQALFKIAEPATVPTRPAGLEPRRLVLFAFLASMGLGLFVVLAIEQMDTSFDTVEGFQSFANLPIWSVVPSISPNLASRPSQNRKKNTVPGSLGLTTESAGTGALLPEHLKHLQKHRVVTITAPDSIPAEQYGILAMKVRNWSEQQNSQILAVTSSAGSEGKSLTAVNLAVALSQSADQPVLLLDGDLRRPRVHQYLGIRPTKGFSDVLEKKDSLDNAFVRLGKLHVLPGGPIPLNPIGLLTSRWAQELFANLRTRFRYIVLDSPPIMPIVDSHILANLADGVVIVVRARATRRELLRRAIETLNASNVLGVLLNDIEYRDSRYAYVYKYYQEHYLGQR
jgi:polysaccharide chain length determinant protein (PEP-CTERM system associated)